MTTAKPPMSSSQARRTAVSRSRVRPYSSEIDLGDGLGVGGPEELDPLGLEASSDPSVVDDVPVVREGAVLVLELDHEGLGVLEVQPTGRRVSDMADPHAAAERLQRLGGEDLVDEPHPFAMVERPVGAGGDPGRLLAPVLEGAETPIEERGGALALQGDPHDATELTGGHGSGGAGLLPEPVGNRF